jgi:hypothetical protein
MEKLDYWKEGISDAARECGLEITNEQLNYLANAVRGGHECYDMAYPDIMPSIGGCDSEILEIKKKLKREQNAEFCRACNGSGREYMVIGTCHTSSTDCLKCDGNGKIYY